jgi:hypothetical protein
VAKTTILLTDEIPAPPALARLGIETLPVTIGAGTERTRLRFIQFFTANIRNRNTRRAYARAVKQFFEWTEAVGSIWRVSTLWPWPPISRKSVAR